MSLDDHDLLMQRPSRHLDSKRIYPAHRYTKHLQTKDMVGVDQPEIKDDSIYERIGIPKSLAQTYLFLAVLLASGLAYSSCDSLLDSTDKKDVPSMVQNHNYTLGK